MDHPSSDHLLLRTRKLPLLAPVAALTLTLSLAGFGGGSGGSEPPATQNPIGGGGNPVLPVTAAGLTVTANENFADSNFVDVEKYNQAIDNYNNAGTSLTGGNP
ncbi:hypothetical protein OBB00_08580 [Gammaproteobacteria bacterium]|nr:hypothetical protein [Gammaproteobacteria bacterium]